MSYTTVCWLVAKVISVTIVYGNNKLLKLTFGWELEPSSYHLDVNYITFETASYHSLDVPRPQAKICWYQITLALLLDKGKEKLQN